MILYKFPRESSKLYIWAERYVDVWSAKGWLPASKFIQEYVPEQFWHQLRPLIEQELLKRGIQVEF